MRHGLSYIWICLLSLLALTACDVHEFPEHHFEKVPFTLHLEFDTEMPIYKDVFYTRTGEIDPETKAAADRHDIRYIINAYRTEMVRNGDREPEATFVFSKHDIDNLNYTATVELEEGNYTFLVWADYVDAGSLKDKYYVTSDFTEIILASKKPHMASTDYRDAFRGELQAEVINPNYYTDDVAAEIRNEVTIPMRRPMGKYKFVSTDVEVFLTRVAEQMREEGKFTGIDPNADPKFVLEMLLRSIDLSEYKVVIRYSAFMPCSFNMFTNKPADSWTGVSYESEMRIESLNEMNLGYDYIFVNGNETQLGISVAVYNSAGEEISSTDPILVPIVRSKLTQVRGEFLTSKSSGGVQVQPEFNGEYNIII